MATKYKWTLCFCFENQDFGNSILFRISNSVLRISSLSGLGVNMRFIAIVLNIALFLLGMQQLITGYPWGNEELVLMILIVVCPLVNMFILTHVQEEVSWLGLLLKRKKLEEQEHILQEQELIIEEQEKIERRIGEKERRKLEETKS